jgi:hypothetical protein
MYVHGDEIYRGNTAVPGVKKAKWEGEGGCYGMVQSLEASQT